MAQQLWTDQLSADAVVTGSARPNADQLAAAVIVKGATCQQADQMAASTAVKAVTHHYIDQQGAGAVVNPPARVSQIVLTALVFNYRNPDMLVYPDRDLLPGLGFNVKWTPKFYNAPTQTTAAGIDVDLSYSAIPTHDFELTYEFLRDDLTPSEFKILMGFFLACRGTFGRFLFQNPDDYAVTGEAIGTTDGTTSVFGPIERTFGASGYTAREPVGQINTGAISTVYLDGVALASSAWSWVTTTPGAQYLKFSTTPASGQAITADFSFYYYCKFPDNDYTFEKFMNQIWLTSSIKLHSCKAGG